MQKNILFTVALVLTTLLITTGCNTPNSPAEKPAIQVPDLNNTIWRTQNTGPENTKSIQFLDGKATVREEEVALKQATEGTYSVSGNKVTVTRPDNISRTFTYENDSLTGTWWDDTKVTLKQEK